MKKTVMTVVMMAMLCLGIQAQTSTFKYTSSEKIERFEEIQYFVGATGVKSHDWNEATGEGIVVYEGTVTELGNNALQWQGTMTALEIPEGVTTLGFQSVQCCYNLSSVSLPKSLKHVKNMAFYYTAFEKGKFIIDDLAWWCSIQFDAYSSNPLYYAKHVYSDKDTEITDLVIPEGVTRISPLSFVRCEGIKSVTFPSTLTSIGWNAFYQSGLESVAIPESVTEIEEYTFSGCANLKSVTIPEGVTNIGFCAFNYCGIESLTLPSTIRKMSQSFHSCNKLTSLTLTDGITTLSQSFYSCNALKEVYIPGSVKLESGDFNRCENLETVSIAEGVEEIMGFYNCWNLKSVTLPSTTSKVESYGFSGCNSLTSVTCLALEPPATTGQIPGGQGVGMEGRTLYVPALTQDHYKEAKNWQDFPSIETLDVMPQTIAVRGNLHLTLPSNLPEGKPNVKLLHDNDPKYGILTVDGNNLSMSDFNILWDYYMQYRNSSRDLNHCSLINNTTMEADNVSTDLWIYSRIWTFVALPFDFKVSEVEPAADGNTDCVIYTYDSRKRAEGEMTETWVKMTGDDIIKARQGFIVQGQRKLNGRSRDDVGLRFKSIDNANKNRMFQTTGIDVPLTLYDSEFIHNRNWNFIGNPYPCYFDTEYMDFRAPITVWNMNGKRYEALRPGDDDYVLCPGESFFVQCPDDKQAIVFNVDGRQTTRAIRPAAQSGRRTTSTDRAIFNIILSDGTTTDRTRIVINDKASVQYELDKDASKFFADDKAVPQIYTKSDDICYAINERPLASGIITLCTTKGNGGYSTIALANDVQDYELILEDSETGTLTPLKDGQGYSFNANGQTFMLHVKHAATGIQTIDNGELIMDDDVYDLQGRKVEHLSKGLFIMNGKKIIR